MQGPASGSNLISERGRVESWLGARTTIIIGIMEKTWKLRGNIRVTKP